MDRTEYEQLKESGGLVSDADLRQAETEITPDDRYEEPAPEEPQEPEQPDEPTEPEHPVEPSEPTEDDELPELPEDQKTAFQKRLEREQKKIREQAEKELAERYETQYEKHKRIVDELGRGDPDAILRQIEENRQNAEITQRAQSLAYQYGWEEEQTREYIQQEQTRLNQQRQQENMMRELQVLRIQNDINDLRDNPDYTGIREMRDQIIDKVAKSNGAITVSEAYWALGGPKRAEQVKLEAQQREVARRAQQPRTVLKDSPNNSTGEKPLPADVLRDAKLMGISEEEARRLYNSQPAQDLDEWRAQRKK